MPKLPLLGDSEAVLSEGLVRPSPLDDDRSLQQES